MKCAVTLLGTLILMLTLTVSNKSFSQEKKRRAKEMPSQEETTHRWQEAMTPGTEHERFEERAGTWGAEVKMWMKGSGSEQTISKRTSEQKVLLGGRFLLQDFTAEMMGQPFTGMGFTGYDNFKTKYVAFGLTI